MLYIYYMYILRHEVTAYFNNVQDFSRFCEKKVKDKASSGARCLKSSIKCVFFLFGCSFNGLCWSAADERIEQDVGSA